MAKGKELLIEGMAVLHSCWIVDPVASPQIPGTYRFERRSEGDTSCFVEHKLPQPFDLRRRST